MWCVLKGQNVGILNTLLHFYIYCELFSISLSTTKCITSIDTISMDLNIVDLTVKPLNIKMHNYVV